MSLTVKLYERDWTYLRTLRTPADGSIQIQASRQQATRRTANFEVAVEELQHLRKRGRRVMIGVGDFGGSTVTRTETSEADWLAGQLFDTRADGGDLKIKQVTNLLTNNQASVETDTTGFSAARGTISRSADKAWHGSYSLKIVATEAEPNIVYGYAGSFTAGHKYTAQGRYWGIVGKNVLFMLVAAGGANSPAVIGSVQHTYQGENPLELVVTGTMDYSDRTSLTINAYSYIATGEAAYIDGSQLEKDDHAHAWGYGMHPHDEGSRQSPDLPLNAVGAAASSIISWSATTPAGTSVAVDARLDGEEEWLECINGQPAPCISPGQDLTGRILETQQRLATADTAVEPVLHSLTVAVYPTPPLFSGELDRVEPDIAGTARVTVCCRDLSKVLQLAGWEKDVTYEDPDGIDLVRSITGVAASSELQVGDQIQRQGAFYGRELHATVFGIEQEVVPTAESGDPTRNLYSVDYQAAGLTDLRLVFRVDLKGQDTLLSAACTTNGTLQSVEISTDNEAWVPFVPNATGRYLRYTITRTAGPITAAVTVTTAVARPATNVLTDNGTCWQPRAVDLDRQLTLSFASAQVSGLAVRMGITDLDRDIAFRARLEALVAGVWTVLQDNILLVSGLNDLCWDTVTATGLRLTTLAGNGQTAVRWCQVRYTSSTCRLDKVVRAICRTEGMTDFSRVESTFRVARNHVLTCERGTYKLDSLIDLAASIAREFFRDAQGRPVFRARRWADPTAPVAEYQRAINWAAPQEDDVENVILARYEAGDRILVATARNDSGGSATSTVNLGTRTSREARNPYAHTQALLDQWAQEILAERSQLAVAGRLQVPWDGVILPEPGEYVRVVESVTGTDRVLAVEAVMLAESADACELTLQFGRSEDAEFATSLRDVAGTSELREAPKVETATVVEYVEVDVAKWLAGQPLAQARILNPPNPTMFVATTSRPGETPAAGPAPEPGEPASTTGQTRAVMVTPTAAVSAGQVVPVTKHAGSVNAACIYESSYLIPEPD